MTDTAIKQAKSFSKAITYPSFKLCNDNLIQHYAISMGEWGESILFVRRSRVLLFSRLRTPKILHFEGGMKKKLRRDVYLSGYELFADISLPSPTMIASTGWSWLATGISSGGVNICSLSAMATADYDQYIDR